MKTATGLFKAVLVSLLFTFSSTQLFANSMENFSESFPEQLNESFSLFPLSNWSEGSTKGDWVVKFTGYGEVGIEREGTNNVTYQMPKKSTSSNETHASLITTKKEYSNVDISLKMKTVKQLRAPNANPWETAWVFWNYTDNTHFYYFTLKPNGWELGKGDPSYAGAQRFLKTGESPFLTIGSWNEVRIIQQGPLMSVWVDGLFITSFLDSERPYLSGNVGLYNEDAHVRFDDVVISSSSETYIVQN